MEYRIVNRRSKSGQYYQIQKKRRLLFISYWSDLITVFETGGEHFVNNHHYYDIDRACYVLELLKRGLAV